MEEHQQEDIVKEQNKRQEEGGRRRVNIDNRSTRRNVKGPFSSSRVHRDLRDIGWIWTGGKKEMKGQEHYVINTLNYFCLTKLRTRRTLISKKKITVDIT